MPLKENGFLWEIETKDILCCKHFSACYKNKCFGLAPYRKGIILTQFSPVSVKSPLQTGWGTNDFLLKLLMVYLLFPLIF